MIPNREQAMSILKKHTETPYLIKHAIAVEGTMRHFAAQAGEDVDFWGVVGLLHDVDYEKYPEEHCQHAEQMLKDEDVDADVIHAVLSHAYGICSDVEPTRHMEKVLFAIDELTGLVSAAALMRPSKSVKDIEVKSVVKKFKTPTFAAKIDRTVIEKGAENLGVSLDTLIEGTIEGMRSVADEIGL